MIVIINLTNPDRTTMHSKVVRTFLDGVFYCVDEPEGLFKYQLSNIWLTVEKEDEKKEAE